MKEIEKKISPIKRKPSIIDLIKGPMPPKTKTTIATETKTALRLSAEEKKSKKVDLVTGMSSRPFKKPKGVVAVTTDLSKNTDAVKGFSKKFHLFIHFL